MRRRELLVGVAAAFAGCSAVDPLEGRRRSSGHPLAGTTTVAVVDRSDGDHDLEALTGEALRFWEDNTERYVGFEVEFRVVEADPDVEVEFLNGRRELDRCREYGSDSVLGCAPLLREGHRPDRPVTAEVVATGRPYGEVRVTTQHELGHLLGLGHDDEPAYVMSTRIEDRLPEYRRRIEVLETFEAALETRKDGTLAYNEGIEFWNDRAYEAAAERFERARERYRSVREHVAAAEEAAEAFEGMNRPETVDRERLAAYLEAVRTVAELSADVAENMRAAADAAVEGDDDRVRDRREAAAETLTDLRSVDAPTPSDVAGALGLIREGAGVDVEEPDRT